MQVICLGENIREDANRECHTYKWKRFFVQDKLKLRSHDQHIKSMTWLWIRMTAKNGLLDVKQKIYVTSETSYHCTVKMHV